MSTTGTLAELERARVRARDALFDWGRVNRKGATLDVLLLIAPQHLTGAFETALAALMGARRS